MAGESRFADQIRKGLRGAGNNLVIIVPAALDVRNGDITGQLCLAAVGSEAYGLRQIGEEKGGRVYATVICAITAGKCSDCSFHVNADNATRKAVASQFVCQGPGLQFKTCKVTIYFVYRQAFLRSPALES